jgi:hypothetical protein
MNATTIFRPNYGFQTKGFATSFVEAVRRLNNSSFSPLPLGPEPFFPASLEPTGIADSVNRIVIGRSTPLSHSLRQRVGELSDLKPNWDGEKAKPIRAPVLGDVVEFLRRLAQHTSTLREPFLAPTFDGFVQIEWHDKKRSLEMEAVSMSWAVVGSLNGKDNKRLYFEAECERSDFDQLEKFYEWFVGNELIWPSR